MFHTEDCLYFSVNRSVSNNFIFPFFSRPRKDPMIATSMALLSTGTNLDGEAALVQPGLLRTPSGEERVQVESAPVTATAEIQILDGDLLLEPGLLCPEQSTNPIGNFSPVYSPLSTASTDSGVGGGLGLSSTDNDNFLAELFGADFPLLSQSSVCGGTNTNSVSIGGAKNSLVPMLTRSEEKTNALDTKPTLGESQVDRNRKNAEAARQNRIKKKRYLEELEKEHSEVKRENVILKTKCHEYQQKCHRLQAEVEYLKNVIANESMLSGLIQNIPDVPNVKLSSSFASRKRPHPTNPSDGAPKSKKSKSASGGGICLHVDKDSVSIEFCQHCSKLATHSQ